MELAADLGLLDRQATSHYYLAVIALDRGRPDEALPHLLRALELSERAKAPKIPLQAVHALARYLAMIGEKERAASLLYFVIDHPGCPQATAKRCADLLAEISASLTARERAQARRRAAAMSVNKVLAQLPSVSEAGNGVIHSKRRAQKQRRLEP